MGSAESAMKQVKKAAAGEMAEEKEKQEAPKKEKAQAKPKKEAGNKALH